MNAKGHEKPSLNQQPENQLIFRLFCFLPSSINKVELNIFINYNSFIYTYLVLLIFMKLNRRNESESFRISKSRSNKPLQNRR